MAQKNVISFIPSNQNRKIAELSEQFADDSQKSAQLFPSRHITQTLTILFTDLVGSTAIKSEAGIHKAHTLETVHKNLLLSALRETQAIYRNNDSQAVRVEGDSYIFVFLNPSEAVHFALLAQALHRQAKISQWHHLPEFRVGIHLGEVIVEEGLKGPNQPGGIGDIKGLQADTTARIMGLASGGQILCSYAAYENAKQALKGIELSAITAKVVWHRHGLYQLKGLEDPVEICEVGEEGAAPLTKPVGSEKAKPFSIREERPQRRMRWMFAAIVLVFILLASAVAIRYFIQTYKPPVNSSVLTPAESAVDKLKLEIIALRGTYETIPHYGQSAIQDVRNKAPVLARQILNIVDSDMGIRHKILKYQFGLLALVMSADVETNIPDKRNFADQSIHHGNICLELMQEASLRASGGNKDDQEIYDWIHSKQRQEFVHYLLAMAYAVKSRTGDDASVNKVFSHLDAIPSAYKERYPLDKEENLKWVLNHHVKSTQK